MIDLAIIAGYMVVVLLIGLFYSGKASNLKEYSIGSRYFSQPIIIASLTATLIGGGSTVGMAQHSFTAGLIFPIAYSGMALSRLLVALIVVPRIEPHFGCVSIGQIMGRFYGLKARAITGLLTITTSIFMVGAHLTAMGFISEALLHIPRSIGLIACTLVMLAYTTRGGIASVSFTDYFQFICILVAIPICCIIGLVDIGGIANLTKNLPTTHFQFWNTEKETLNFYQLMFICYAIPACYPVVIQRILMSKNAKKARQSLIFTAGISICLFFSISIIGMIARVKEPNLVPEKAFPFLVEYILPTGIRGFAIAGLFAVLMSTIDSFLNSIGIAISNDICPVFTNLDLTEQRKLSITKTTVFIAGFLSLLSAICFEGVLEGLFASMNLWIPIIFPTFMVGLFASKPCERSFYIGTGSALISLLILKWFAISSFFVVTLLTASVNFVATIFSHRGLNLSFDITTYKIFDTDKIKRSLRLLAQDVLFESQRNGWIMAYKNDKRQICH